MIGGLAIAIYMEFLGYLVARTLFAVISVLPQPVAIGLLAGLARSLLFLLPRYRKIALNNLKVAFPKTNWKWREEVLKQSCIELARLLVDFGRLPYLSEEWMNQHVDAESLKVIRKHLGSGNPGTILATGHLGSFELLAQAVAMNGVPLRFVVRNFKNRLLDKWWNARRAGFGGKVISREGAFRHAVQAVNSGESVGILFDQNITANHAVFVEFFNRLAATTKIIGLLALRTKAPVIVISITYTGGDRYRVNCTECDFTAIHENETLTKDEKVFHITQEVSKVYEEMIAADPKGWFWMHRRWKTRPPEEHVEVNAPEMA